MSQMRSPATLACAQLRPTLHRGLGLLAAAILTFAGGNPATAQTMSPVAAPTVAVQMAVGKSEPLVLDGPVSRIVVSQPETAKVAVAGPGSIYVMGRDVGATNLLVYGPGDRLLQTIDVNVGYDGRHLEADIREALPGERVEVATFSTGVMLRGSVSTPEAKAVALDLAERAAPDAVISTLEVRPHQVVLDVQLVEASEEDLRDIGFDVSATGRRLTVASGSGLVGASPPHDTIRIQGTAGDLRLDAALRALETRGAARILARPQLLALSGETAAFRSGGEFPFPVPSRDGVTVEFRPYGTALAMRPTVQANGLIRLELTSEVSSLDPRNSLRVQGFTVPALLTRKVSTTLEVRDGDRFLFAGLFSEADERQASQTPGLSDLPGVGRLFRAGRDRTQRLQLALIVTARLVNGPNADAGTPQEPDELLDEPAETRAASTRSESSANLAKQTESPVARAVVRRVATLAHALAEAPSRAWTAARAWSRQLLGFARLHAPTRQTVQRSAAVAPIS